MNGLGATEYGGPGDPSSGTTGARGDNLVVHPDTYAELGGLTWQTATAMGGLGYMAPLRITWSAMLKARSCTSAHRPPSSSRNSAMPTS